MPEPDKRFQMHEAVLEGFKGPSDVGQVRPKLDPEADDFHLNFLERLASQVPTQTTGERLIEVERKLDRVLDLLEGRVVEAPGGLGKGRLL